MLTKIYIFISHKYLNLMYWKCDSVGSDYFLSCVSYEEAFLHSFHMEKHAHVFQEYSEVEQVQLNTLLWRLLCL
jgi:hypothetical protein